MSTVITTIPVASRQGHLQFDAAKVPAQFNGSFIIRPSIDLADLATTKELLMTVYVFDPAVNDYRHVADGRWKGPSDPARPSSLPVFRVPIDQRMHDNPVRATFDIPQPLLFGGTIEIE
jgi:hypothetical protein